MWWMSRVVKQVLWRIIDFMKDINHFVMLPVYNQSWESFNLVHQIESSTQLVLMEKYLHQNSFIVQLKNKSAT